MTEARAAKLYSLRAKEVAAATHHGELAAAVRFMAWCVKKGWLRLNPFEGVEPQGQAARGKPQLRVDEAKRFLAVLLGDPSPEATAVTVSLLMGLRAREVVARVVRDLDDGGRLLWIPESKTAAGVRQVRVPTVLMSRLLILARGKGPQERLFGDMTRHGLHYHTVRFAKLAGVPRVTPHGLRGTFATLAVAGGDGGTETVARTIGHADAGTTLRRHYLAPGAEDSAKVRSLEGLITPQLPERNETVIDPELSTSKDEVVMSNRNTVTTLDTEDPVDSILPPNRLN
jgi:integrase